MENLYTELDNLHMELQDILIEVDDMLADWEESQATNTSANTNTDTDATDAITRWSLDAWTDYDSFKLLDIDLDSKKIEDEDGYTIWLLFHNKNHALINRGTSLPTAGLAVDYLFYNTSNGTLQKVTSISPAVVWEPITNFASIYQPVEIKEITIQFSPKSSDRVAVDESQTELYSTGYPSFDWDMDFNNRINGTCKRMEATTETRFTIPVPTRFINNDPEKPYPEEFKLEFELAYKQ